MGCFIRTVKQWNMLLRQAGINFTLGVHPSKCYLKQEPGLGLFFSLWVHLICSSQELTSAWKPKMGPREEFFSQSLLYLVYGIAEKVSSQRLHRCASFYPNVFTSFNFVFCIICGHMLTLSLDHSRKYLDQKLITFLLLLLQTPARNQVL